MKMKRDAMSVAKYIIDKCAADKQPVSNLQLQKILYYIQVAFYKNFNQACFEDNFEAWMFGPVMPAVYYKYCGAGACDIVMKYPEFRNMWSTNEKNLVDSIIEEKREENPWALVNDTHEKGKAWALTYQDGKGNKCIIDKSLIRDHG